MTVSLWKAGIGNWKLERVLSMYSSNWYVFVHCIDLRKERMGNRRFKLKFNTN